ncbi:MAG TPA: hypothetical protein VF195_03970 [Actinomycetota bacterium]
MIACRPILPDGASRSAKTRNSSGQRARGIDSIISIDTIASYVPGVREKSSRRTSTRSPSPSCAIRSLLA